MIRKLLDKSRLTSLSNNVTEDLLLGTRAIGRLHDQALISWIKSAINQSFLISGAETRHLIKHFTYIALNTKMTSYDEYSQLLIRTLEVYKFLFFRDSS